MAAGWVVTDGARFLAVEPLMEQTATELLSRAVGDDRASTDPSSTSSLVRMCAGLPIALAVTGARLATRPVGRSGAWSTSSRRNIDGCLASVGRKVSRCKELSICPIRSCRVPQHAVTGRLGLHPGAEFGTRSSRLPSAYPRKKPRVYRRLRAGP
jgi:hypothetical protein